MTALLTTLYMLPLLLQGLFIGIDEVLFHRRRGLPPWEVWGHPLDTLTVALPFTIAVTVPYSPEAAWAYGFCSAFSSLFVTKDEFIHARLCNPMEHWIHSILFVLHPLAFIGAAMLWKMNTLPWFLSIQLSLIVGFLIYQICYWGKPWAWLRLATQN